MGRARGHVLGGAVCAAGLVAAIGCGAFTSNADDDGGGGPSPGTSASGSASNGSGDSGAPVGTTEAGITDAGTETPSDAGQSVEGCPDGGAFCDGFDGDGGAWKSDWQPWGQNGPVSGGPSSTFGMTVEQLAAPAPPSPPFALVSHLPPSGQVGWLALPLKGLVFNVDLRMKVLHRGDSNAVIFALAPSDYGQAGITIGASTKNTSFVAGGLALTTAFSTWTHVRVHVDVQQGTYHCEIYESSSENTSGGIAFENPNDVVLKLGVSGGLSDPNNEWRVAYDDVIVGYE